MSLIQQTLSGLFWSSSGKIIQSILQVFVLVVLARLLNVTDFGLIGAATVVVGVSTIFSQLGVGPAVIQRPKLENHHIRTAFTISVILGFIFGCIIFFTASLISSFFRMKELTPILQYLSIIFPIKGIAVVSESLLRRELHFKTLAIVNALSYLIGYALIGIMLAMAGLGVWALVWAILSQDILNSIALLCIKRCDTKPLLNMLSLKQLMEFGTGYTLARIGNYSANQGDNLIVGRYLGADALGIYGRAYQAIMAPVILFGQVLDTVLFPVMATAQHERKRLAAAFKRSSGVLALVLLPLSSFLCILAPEIIKLLLGPKWIRVIAPFQILCLGILFRTSFKMSASLARATNAVYDYAWRQWVYALLVIIGAWVGKNFGVVGVSMGILFAIVSNFFLMTQLGLKLSKVSIGDFFRGHIPGILLTCLVSLIIYPTIYFLRRAMTPLYVNLLVPTGLAIILAVFLSKKYPNIFIGEDGKWLIRIFLERVPVKIKNLLRLLKIF